MQEEIEISASEEKGWLGKIKDTIYENWQTLLVALIVLIVGVSAYNYNTKTGATSAPAAQENSAEEPAADNAAADQEQYVEEKDQEAAAAQDQTATDTTASTEEAKAETKTEEQNTNTVENSGDGYKVLAEKGDGITHLARKAIVAYLSENADSEVTALHKIYAEDYLQNRVGSQRIEVGHEETFTKASIEEAIGAAKQLSEKSLDNLKKYETKIQ